MQTPSLAEKIIEGVRLPPWLSGGTFHPIVSMFHVNLSRGIEGLELIPDPFFHTRFCPV